jgi:hypothetical protein
MGIKYKTERVYAGRYDVYVTDDNGEYPQRVGCITGGNDTWLAEQGQINLGYHKTKKKALQAIQDSRAVKTSVGESVSITIQEQSV